MQITTTKSKTRQNMAMEFGIDRKTFCNWCEKEGIELPVRERIKPNLQEIIYQAFGDPHQKRV